MKNLVYLLLALGMAMPASAQSKYGLSCYGDACNAMDHRAAERMTNAKTICASGNSGFVYPKKDPPKRVEEQLYWQDIFAAERAAESDYRVVSDCSKADLIIKTTLDLITDNISLIVTDGDSGEAVFAETRSIQDTRSDSIHAAQHFRDAVKTAKLALLLQQQQEEEARQEQKREQQRQEQERNDRCETELNSLRQRIDGELNYPVAPVLQSLLGEITTHNNVCPENAVNSEIIERLEKTYADNQSKEAAEKALREKNTKRLEKAKADALAVWQQRVALAAFVPPVEGWVRAAALPNTLSYIILPTGLASNCHFSTDGSKPALDCLGAKRSNYFAVQNNEHWYLLKSKWTASGEYAGTIKDGGFTMCLRKAGCYSILAEIRQSPTQLPDRFQIPAPGALTLTYSNDDLSFSHPQNWKTEEKKSKDNVIVAVNVAAPEAHLASWITHGFFVGHVASNSQTLDGAYDLFTEQQRQRGLVIGTDVKAFQVDGAQAKIVTYTSPSVLSAGENGWIVVVKDKSEGYYWMMMFYPSSDDSLLYTRTFTEILKSLKLRK